MPYIVKKFMMYDGEAFHRGAVWTPKGFRVDKEIIHWFVTEEADDLELQTEPPIELQSEPVIDLTTALDSVEGVTDVTPIPHRQRGRDASRHQ